MTASPLVAKFLAAVAAGSIPPDHLADVLAAARIQIAGLVAACPVSRDRATAQGPRTAPEQLGPTVPGSPLDDDDDARREALRSKSKAAASFGSAAPEFRGVGTVRRDPELESLLVKFGARTVGIADGGIDSLQRLRAEWRELRDRRLTHVPLNAYIEHRLQHERDLLQVAADRGGAL